MSAISLGFVFTGRDLASRTFSKVDSNFGRLERNTAKSSKVMQASMAAVAGGMAAMAVGFIALKKQFDFADVAGKFRQQLVATSRIMVDGTQNLEALRSKALDVGLRTKFDPQEIIRGLRGLAESGFNAAQAMSAIEPSANLATMGEIKLSQASGAIAGTLRSFRLEADQATNVADKLGVIINRTKFQARDFASGLADGAVEMGMWNQTLEDTLALTGALRNTNMRASKASTAMRESARRVFSQKSAIDKLTAAGIPVLEKETGERRRLVDIIFDMADAQKKMGKTQAGLFASGVLGARGSKLLGAAVARGREKIDADIEAMNNSAGTAKRFVDALNDTFQGQKDLLRGAVETLKVAVGEGFADVLKPVIAFLLETVTAITKVVDGMPAPMKKAAAAVAVFSAGILGLAGAGALLVGVLGMTMVLMTSFGGVALATVGVFVTLVAGVSLLTAGLIGLGTAADIGVEGGRNLVDFWEDVKLVFDGVKQALSGEGIKGETLFKLVKKENRDLLIWVVNISRWINRAKHFIKGMWVGFRAGIEQARPELNAFNKAFEDLGKVLGISNDKNELMNTSVGEATQKGASFGQTLSKVAIVGIKFMTSMIELSTLLIDNFESLKNILMLIAGIAAGAAFARLGGMGGAARAAGGAGAGAAGMLPMMMGPGGAKMAAGGAGAAMSGFMANGTPMPGTMLGDQKVRTKYPSNSIPLPGMPADNRSRYQRMRDSVRSRGGFRGMASAGAGRAFGALPGLMGAGMMAQGASQASEGNYGSAAMTAGMGAMMVGKQGFKTALGIVAKHPVVLGTIAAGVAGGMATKHMIEKKGESENALLNNTLGGGAQHQYLSQNDRISGFGWGTSNTNKREQVKTIGSMTEAEREAAKKAGNIRSHQYYKNRMSHWAQMDEYKKHGIDASKMATRNSSGQIMGGRGDQAGGVGGGDFVGWTTKAHLEAMRQAHKEGLMGNELKVSATFSEFTKAEAEAKKTVDDSTFANTTFIGGE